MFRCVHPEVRVFVKTSRHKGGMFTGLILLSAFLLFSPAVNASAPEDAPTEYQVKAAFMYNFLKFIQWPPEYFSERDTFMICIFGRDPFGKDIEFLREKRIYGKSISIKRVGNLKGLTGCDLLFVSRSAERMLPQILGSLKGTVLTVSDIDGFSSSGGVIEFVIEGNKVRFIINREAAEKAGLRISSKLYWLSRKRPGRR